MACGTGKTLLARFLHDALSASRTLVLVPSRSLLKQSLREWLSVGAFDYLAVCSDDTVTPDDADAVVAAAESTFRANWRLLDGVERVFGSS
jgi:predicted helicase